MATAEPSPPKANLTRQLTLIPLIGLIFFNVSGGAYSLEELTSISGPGMAVLLLAAIPIFYGIPIAAITTELATAIPNEGGTYVWARRGLGEFAAFQAGILRWLNSWAGMAIYPVLFASYLSMLFLPATAGRTVYFSAGPITIDLHWIVGVVCVIIPMAVINVRGAKSVGDSSVLFAIISLGPLAALSVIGITKLFTDGINPVTPFIPDGTSATAAIGAGLSLVMWSYCGFDRVGLIAGEIKNPTRIIPKAMAISMVVIIAGYVLPLIGSMAVPGWESWVAGSFGDIGLALSGTWLQVLVTVGGMFAMIGLYSSLLMGNSRALNVLSTDRWVPAVLSKPSRRFGTPIISIVVSSIIYAIFSMGEFIDLVVVDVFLINLLLMISLVSLIGLRIKEPHLLRPAKIPGGWFGIAMMAIPMTAIIGFSIWYTMSGYGMKSVWLIIGTLTLSTLSYFPARRYQRRRILSEQICICGNLVCTCGNPDGAQNGSPRVTV